jgi:hypothetical protein
MSNYREQSKHFAGGSRVPDTARGHKLHFENSGTHFQYSILGDTVTQNSS